MSEKMRSSLYHLVTISLLCPSLGAGEEKRKSDEVHCPVCRAIWPYTTPITSPSTGPSVMPVSVPIGTCGYRSGEGGMVGGMRLKSVSPAHPSQILSAEKSHLVKRLKSVCLSQTLVCPLSPLVSYPGLMSFSCRFLVLVPLRNCFQLIGKLARRLYPTSLVKPLLSFCLSLLQRPKWGWEEERRGVRG